MKVYLFYRNNYLSIHRERRGLKYLNVRVRAGDIEESETKRGKGGEKRRDTAM